MPSRSRRRVARPTPASRSAPSRTNTSTGSSATRCSRRRAASPAGDESTLSALVDSRLRGRGVEALWSHQAHAIDALRHRRHVAVATGTASGKSLCYQVPIVESIAGGGRDTALLIFPTKALAQDQLRTFREWLVPDLVAATYDGDTPFDERTWIRNHANVILTNPEMLHMGILPSHRAGRRSSCGCATSSLTSCTRCGGCSAATWHTCCAGSAGCASTTAPSPRSASPARRSATRRSSRPRLCGLAVEAIDGDGSPQAERSFAVWQRPLIDVHTGTRASANIETAMLLSRFVADGHQTLAFTRSRKGAELVATHARGMLAEHRTPESSPSPAVAAYRAGLPRRRAARARGAAGERRARRGGGNERARARHRRRFARRRGAQRLPGHALVDAPAGRPGGTHDAAGGGGARRRRRPARPVVRASS